MTCDKESVRLVFCRKAVGERLAVDSSPLCECKVDGDCISTPLPYFGLLKDCQQTIEKLSDQVRLLSKEVTEVKDEMQKVLLPMRAEKVRKKIPDVMLEDISIIKLRAAITNTLISNGTLYVGDLVILSRKRLLRIPGMGKKGVEEIEEGLSHLGLELGQNIDGWQYYLNYLYEKEMGRVV